jgi:hypothetical protein
MEIEIRTINEAEGLQTSESVMKPQNSLTGAIIFLGGPPAKTT